MMTGKLQYVDGVLCDNVDTSSYLKIDQYTEYETNIVYLYTGSIINCARLQSCILDMIVKDDVLWPTHIYKYFNKLKITPDKISSLTFKTKIDESLKCQI